ncbi:MAG: YidC/Oxa1 family membrane protein insertase [Oscillospiraceae bacterium]|nr:YidC/Oxa1 family membrane protein insertase [Oscillospiraceae bacterium]
MGIILQPLSALLLFLYNLVSNYGVAMILFSLIAKILLLYFSARGKAAMMRQQALVPKQKELEKQFGKDKQKYNEAVMKLYQDEGVSMMGGCLWSLLPFPIFLLLLEVVRKPLTYLVGLTAQQVTDVQGVLGVTAPANTYYYEMELASQATANLSKFSGELADKLGSGINFDLFPGFDLSPIPNVPWDGGFNWLLLIPVLSCATAYMASFLSQKFNKTSAPKGNMRFMFLLMPLLSLWIGFSTPAAMGVYWISGNVFTVVQDYFLTKYYRGKMEKEAAHKAALLERRRLAEEKQREEERLRRIEQGEDNMKNTSKKKQYRLKNAPKSRPGQDEK